MTSEVLSHITSWFQEHINSFFPENVQSGPDISFRIEHIRHVAEFCKKLAEELRWPEKDILTAEIIGMLHDVGRFSQYAEFATFIDADSVNHGERGFSVVNNSTVLSSLSSQRRRTVLDGIRYHNDKKFHTACSPESIPFVKLVRDADKLDKLRNARLTIQCRKDESTAPTLNVLTDGPVTTAVLDQILAHKTVSKKNIQSEIDFRLMQMSLVFDINYSPAYKLIAGSNVLEIISSILPDDKTIRKAAKIALQFLSEQV